MNTIKLTKRLLNVVLLFLISYSTIAQNGISKIAFGSCIKHDKPLPILDVVVKHKPNLFIFLGDNIYGNTYNMDSLQSKYTALGNNESFKNLKNNVDIIATWGDNDYGVSDAGRHYPYKSESKNMFLDFFNEPKNSERRKHEGIYTSYMYNDSTTGKNVQVILLDTKTFRDNLKKYRGEVNNDERYFYKLKYAPYSKPDSSLLGAQQWAWIENELMKPADVRLVGSSTQFGAEFNGYESWADFPHEQKRFINLVKKTKANGVMFLSGDLHYAEVSKLSPWETYPIYDITTSGMVSSFNFATPNDNRIEGPILDNHFGLITIDWKKRTPKIKVEIINSRDIKKVEMNIRIDEISFQKENLNEEELVGL